jgi:hypothetical protein
MRQLYLGSVWLKSQVEQSRSVPVLLLFGYKVTRTEWLQLGNIPLRSETIPLQKINRMETLRSQPALFQFTLQFLLQWLFNQTKDGAALLQFTLQPNKKQSRSVPAYQTQNRAAPFLELEMEQLRSIWLLNQTLPYYSNFLNFN